VQTYWLLLAISQDQPKNKHIAEARDRCEQAALEGYWVSLHAHVPLHLLSATKSFRCIVWILAGRSEHWRVCAWMRVCMAW
jgi:hypothetical protein